MGQAKLRGTREQRVAAAKQRENAVKLGAALATARQQEAIDADRKRRDEAAVRKREALREVAVLDMRDPPARAVIVGGVSPRMRLALAGLGSLIDRVGVVNSSAVAATAVGDAQ